mmetsp:Transcript_2264/g.4659  ORF Transcript_2264/g.4659 Transcript_2264/m.4659 type:complete len:252 (+) Transcript_2264:310-1065(+)
MIADFSLSASSEARKISRRPSDSVERRSPISPPIVTSMCFTQCEKRSCAVYSMSITLSSSLVSLRRLQHICMITSAAMAESTFAPGVCKLSSDSSTTSRTSSTTLVRSTATSLHGEVPMEQVGTTSTESEDVSLDDTKLTALSFKEANSSFAAFSATIASPISTSASPFTFLSFTHSPISCIVASFSFSHSSNTLCRLPSSAFPPPLFTSPPPPLSLASPAAAAVCDSSTSILSFSPSSSSPPLPPINEEV